MSHYADEGNIAELEFGKEFIFSVDGSGGSETRCLTNDETFVILDKLKKNREGNEAFKSTLQYLTTITPTRDTDLLRSTASELRNALDTLELTVKRDMERERLHPVEVAELANLIPEDCTLEEALAWIPSLARFEDEDIMTALEYITRSKSKIDAYL